MLEGLIHILVAAGKERAFITKCLSNRGLNSFIIDSAWEFLEFSKGAPPDCLVLDVNLPGLNGLEILNRMKTAGHLLPPTIVLGPANIVLATRVMKHGATDYLARPVGKVALINAVMACLENGDGSNMPSDNFLNHLSKREREVLALLAQGKSVVAAAEFLGVKPETIHFHSKNIRQKAEVTSTKNLVATALQNGLIV